MEDWSRWYKKDYPVAGEACFQSLRPKLPSYIDSVIDFGCAAGRNLALFDGGLKLYGVDLVPEEQIEWRQPLRDLTYISSPLQNFASRFTERMDRFLCISHGTIMYLAGDEQRTFIENLARLGCRTSSSRIRSANAHKRTKLLGAHLLNHCVVDPLATRASACCRENAPAGAGDRHAVRLPTDDSSEARFSAGWGSALRVQA